MMVKNGRTMLLAVDSAADRQIAEVRAREVTGVFKVENDLTVIRAAKEAGSRSQAEAAAGPSAPDNDGAKVFDWQKNQTDTKVQ